MSQCDHEQTFFACPASVCPAPVDRILKAIVSLEEISVPQANVGDPKMPMDRATSVSAAYLSRIS
jgi:hypothetical protein